MAESPGAASILAELKSKLENCFTSSLMLMQDKLERLSLVCLYINIEFASKAGAFLSGAPERAPRNSA